MDEGHSTYFGILGDSLISELLDKRSWELQKSKPDILWALKLRHAVLYNFFAEKDTTQYHTTYWYKWCPLKISNWYFKRNYLIIGICSGKVASQKLKLSIRDFFSIYDEIRRKLWIWSHLLKKSLIEKFIFRAVSYQTVKIQYFCHLQSITIAKIERRKV